MMKKLFVAGVIFLLGVFALAAQSKPIIGYDKVPWGTSIEDVKKVYPNYNFKETDFSDWDEEVMWGPRPIYREFVTGPDGRVSRRNFFFYNDKLYAVNVVYDPTKVNAAMFQSMTDVLVERYGPVTSKTSHANMVGTFLNYSDELRIGITYLTDGRNSSNVYYANPKVEKQIELDQVQF
jgi:hypothetical protein